MAEKSLTTLNKIPAINKEGHWIQWDSDEEQ